MEGAADERMSLARMSLARLRWRLRGASQWPAFGLALIADALLLHLLPIAGTATGIAPAVLLAFLFNLVAVAVLAPLGAALLRLRRPDLPRIIARDHVGTALIAAIALAVAALGIAHHSAVGAHERMFRSLSNAVRGFVAGHAPAEYRRRVDRADVLQLDAGLYRACVPGNGSRRQWCMLVEMSRARPSVRADPSGSPNASYGHPLD